MTSSKTYFCSSLNDISGRGGGFGSKSPHELGSWRFLAVGTTSGERERFCEAVNCDELREVDPASRLATPSWIAFLRVSENVLRLVAVAVAVGAEAGHGMASVVLFDEKSRLSVARPERGCRLSCIITRDDERNV